MAVDEINSTNPVLPTALQSRVQTSVPLAASPLATVKNPVAVATAATQGLTPAQQAALLGSEAVQTLNLGPTSPAEPLLATGVTPGLTTVTESQGLSPAQQAALAVNETVQTAIEPHNLTPAQQAALTVNQATQTLTVPLTTPETTITPAGAAGQTPAAGPTETPFTIGTTTGGATTGVTSTTTTATPTVTTTPATETTIARQGAPPTQQAATQPISYRNAFAVYEVRNPTPPPPDPMPTRKDLHPPLPIGRVRPVDPLVLRQEWEKRKKAKRKEAGRAEEIEPRSPMGEKAIRDLVRQANEDLAANGVPLHLVLVQNEEGFALDIYDSSGDAVCAVTQEVPLDLTHLLTILDNLEHEAGIIINIKT
ncbi:MAG: hypothetical protein WCZ86_05745 [Desulfurivibrionaceae bacterium]